MSQTLIWVALTGCGPIGGSGTRDVAIAGPTTPEGFRLPVEPPPLAPPLSTEGAAGFGGIGQITPLRDGLLVEWDPFVEEDGTISSDYDYEVYAAFDGQEFDYQVF